VSPVAFEAAFAADAEGLVAIRIAAMRESLERIGRFDPQRVRDRLLANFDPACTRHVVAEGARVGFVVVRPQDDGLVLDHLYNHPSAQGRGIGCAVMADVLAVADARRLPVRVGALRESAANRFYERHGFELVERGEWDNHYLRPCARAGLRAHGTIRG
jgi:ribosomal protein S18 acetylase RimI-like enzyme